MRSMGASPSLVVTALRGVATVQDGGRPGHMHEGVPPGGALVPELLARANRAAGNDDGAAAIELFGGMTVTADGAGIVVATSAGVRAPLAHGERFDVALHARARVTYVAIEGGIDVPYVLGGRGTLLVAKLGGLDGRPLKRGDRLAPLPPRDAVDTPALPPFPDLDAPIEVTPGPDLERFAPLAFEALVASEYRIAIVGDRVGLRLDGAPIARSDADSGLSGPMVRGALQVPSSGLPIVLGPDHPTTGGYPVIAVIMRRSFGSFAARKPGAVVRFTPVRTLRA